MKRKVKPDKNKAKALKLMAKISLERLNSFDKLKYPSNTLDDYYDIIHKLMEAICSLEGIKFSGDYAHKEIIDWISLKLNYSNQKRVFLQNIRNYRNKISYEGFFVKPEFIKDNEDKIKKIIDDLNKEAKKYD